MLCNNFCLMVICACISTQVYTLRIFTRTTVPRAITGTISDDPAPQGRIWNFYKPEPYRPGHDHEHHNNQPPIIIVSPPPALPPRPHPPYHYPRPPPPPNTHIYTVQVPYPIPVPGIPPPPPPPVIQPIPPPPPFRPPFPPAFWPPFPPTLAPPFPPPFFARGAGDFNGVTPSVINITYSPVLAAEPTNIADRRTQEELLFGQNVLSNQVLDYSQLAQFFNVQPQTQASLYQAVVPQDQQYYLAPAPAFVPSDISDLNIDLDEDEDLMDYDDSVDNLALPIRQKSRPEGRSVIRRSQKWVK